MSLDYNDIRFHDTCYYLCQLNDSSVTSISTYMVTMQTACFFFFFFFFSDYLLLDFFSQRITTSQKRFDDGASVSIFSLSLSLYIYIY